MYLCHTLRHTHTQPQARSATTVPSCTHVQYPSVARTRRQGSSLLGQASDDVIVQPVLAQRRGVHARGAGDPTLAAPAGGAARAAERLRHLPLGARVEEGEVVADGEGAVAGDADLEAGHVELQARRARVVAVEQVAVQLDVGVARGLHGRVGPAVRRGRRRDVREVRARREGDEGDGAGGEGCRAFGHLEEVRVAGLRPGRK